MLVNHNIPNLYGGVSRQPDEARFDNQVEEMINFVPTISSGLISRNKLEQYYGTQIVSGSNHIAHSYSKGVDNIKYSIFISDLGIKVLEDDDGVLSEKSVSILGNNPLTTWALSNYRKYLKFITVGDTTWILNTNQVVDTTASTSTASTIGKAFYWVKRSYNDGNGNGYSYQIVVDGNTITKTGTDSKTIASDIASAVSAISGFTGTAKGSIVRISKDDSTDFTYEFGDSWGNQASKGWKDTVSKVADLPSDMSGFSESDVGIVEIAGTDRDEYTSFYLRWTGEYWTETVKGGILNELDAETLPAKLIQKSDGTFQFGFLGNTFEYGDNDWATRDKGDDDSNPMPSFVGSQISNIFFFKNRLGFTSGENVILSETGEYYNFFGTTAMEVLDSDPIDVTVDSDKTANILAVNVTSGGIVLWSENNQFLLSGGEILSPATTRVTITSSYDNDTTIKPISIDNDIIFFDRSVEAFDAYSFSTASLNTDRSNAESITSHIPEYIDPLVNLVIASSSTNTLALAKSGDTKIYLYKYHINNAEKVMSSWFKFKIPVTIEYMYSISETLYIVSNDNLVYSIDLSEKPNDSDTMYDYGAIPIKSIVTLSKFNFMTEQGIKNIRDKFYLKNILAKLNGTLYIELYNTERNKYQYIDGKFLSRKIFVGGHTNKVNVSFTNQKYDASGVFYDSKVSLFSISMEGTIYSRSKNY